MTRGLRPFIASLVSAGLLCPFLISCSLSTSCSAPKPAEVPVPKSDKRGKPDKLDKLLNAHTDDFPAAPGGAVAHGAAAAPSFGAPTAAPAAASKAFTVVGMARNAALGAVVVGANGAVWYIDKMSEWDGQWLNKKVSVSGTTQSRKLAPDPTVGPNGEVSHGMVGTSKVIVGAKVRLATPTP